MPRNANPESFHVEKSEIHNELRRIIGALRTGQAIPHIGVRERQ